MNTTAVFVGYWVITFLTYSNAEVKKYKCGNDFIAHLSPLGSLLLSVSLLNLDLTSYQQLAFTFNMLILPLHSRVSTSSRRRKKSYCLCQNSYSPDRCVLPLRKVSHVSDDIGEGWLSDSANLLEQWLFSPQWHCWMGWWSAGWGGALGMRADTALARHHCSYVWSVWWHCSQQETHS